MGRSSRVKKSLTRVNFESSQEIDIKYLGRAKMLVSKLGSTISLLILCKQVYKISNTNYLSCIKYFKYYKKKYYKKKYFNKYK